MTYRMFARLSIALTFLMLIGGAVVPAASSQTLEAPEGNYDPTEYPYNCWPDIYSPENYYCIWFEFTESRLVSVITEDMPCTLGRSPREATQPVSIVTTEYISYYQTHWVSHDGESWGFSVFGPHTETMTDFETVYGMCKPVPGGPAGR